MGRLGGGRLQSHGGTPTALQNAGLVSQPITAAKGELPFQKEGLSQNQSLPGSPTSVRQVRVPRGWTPAWNRVAVWVSFFSAGHWGAQSWVSATGTCLQHSRPPPLWGGGLLKGQCQRPRWQPPPHPPPGVGGCMLRPSFFCVSGRSFGGTPCWEVRVEE